METTDGSKHAGKFRFGDQWVTGELTLNRGKTSLYAHDPGFFRPDANADRCIRGELYDLTKVSLIDCNAPPFTGSASVAGGGEYKFTDIFPHYVVYGRRHLGPAERVIRQVSFVVDDAATVFYDFDTFSHAMRPRRLIRRIVKAQAEGVKRTIEVGRYPHIAYFTGKGQIFSVDTVLGTISATHNPQTNWGGPGGVFIKNVISVNIDFGQPTDFKNAVDALVTVHMFLSMVAGRRQNIPNILLQVGQRRTNRVYLDVYWSSPPRREETDDRRAPQPSDLPLMAAAEPGRFGAVLQNWLDRHESWRESRGRFISSLCQGHSYGVDRLIASANMFDILPPDAVPKTVPISDEVRKAHAEAKTLFKALPESYERTSILDALGRIGKSSLRHKIWHRAKPLTSTFAKRFPGLAAVIDLAVDCRNHYVHGGKTRADYTANFFATVPFLTDTLEFVFGASDLIECGWDMAEWMERGTTMSHPFGRYAASYLDNLRQLNSVLPEGKRIALT